MHTKHGYEVLVSWEGLEKIENSWKPIHNLINDVWLKVREYARSTSNHAFVAYVISAAGTRELGDLPMHSDNLLAQAAPPTTKVPQKRQTTTKSKHK